MDALSAHCVVEIGSRRFDSWASNSVITEASVELTADKSGQGTLSVFDHDFKLIDSFLNATGLAQLEARFWFGFSNELGDSLFVGRFVRHEWSEGISTFRFHDFSSKMKREKKSRFHNKKTVLQILKKLAEDNELKFVAPDNWVDSDVYDSLVQKGKSDWEFALKIAEQAGLKLYVQGDTLFAKQSGVTGDSTANLNFREDFTLLKGFSLSYKLPENKKGRPSKVEVRGRAKGGKRLTGSNQTGERGVSELIINEDLPKQTINVAKRRAGGKTNRRREYAFDHQLQTLPSFRKKIDLNDTVTLGNFGEFYSGKYIVTEVRYNFAAGKMVCEFNVGCDIK